MVSVANCYISERNQSRRIDIPHNEPPYGILETLCGFNVHDYSPRLSGLCSFPCGKLDGDFNIRTFKLSAALHKVWQSKDWLCRLGDSFKKIRPYFREQLNTKYKTYGSITG